ncbi:MAG TPA: S9 family peptidase [Terriglobales bacterium]|nr:S9 family peptidase [Terriglobales bacterium]
MLRRVVLAILFLGAFSFAQKRPFTFEDMMALKRVSDPAVSPDGKWIAFSAVEVNLEQNKRTPHLWVVPAAGGTAKQVSNEAAGEDRPRWSPNSRQLAFLSSKDGGPQIWLADFDAAAVALGNERKVTEISTGAGGELWSPDGKWLMFTSDVYPDCPDDACNKQRDEQRANSKVKAAIFTHLFFRHWSAFTGDKVTHIFVVPAAGGVARDLTPGAHDAPPFSLGGEDMYAFSPDSQEVAFTSNIDELAAISTNNEIFVVPVSGGTPKKISTSPGSDSTPLYSPDGKYIAWRMQETPGYESDRFQLVVYDRQSGQIRSVTRAFDRWVESFAWSNDSKMLYLTADDKGEAPIYVVPVNGGAVKELIRGEWDSLRLAPDGTIYANKASVQAPSEIWAVHLNGAGGALPTQITDLNHDVLAQIAMQPLEPFWFTSAKDKVEGFLIKPPNFVAGQKYPVKFLIHGGPEGAWGDSWSYRWNAELFAANGYAVVMINPTGSTGYGQRFTQQIQGDWGGRPFDDLLRGLDYVLAHYSYLDGTRVCAMGASYGGYMTNWILGHSDRFRCIVTHDGMFNTESAYGSTEELWFPEWEFKGTPWQQRELYRKWSPMLYATRFKTPTLVVHGQLDYRLDVSEGLQLFTTLQRLKVPSKMLYFPDEGHWVLKPQNSRLWYKTVNEWVDQWVKK